MQTAQKGVTKLKNNKYQVVICKNSENIYIGQYKNYEEACQIRKEYENKTYEELLEFRTQRNKKHTIFYTSPHLVEFLVKKEDAKNFTPNSQVELLWKCPSCNKEFYRKCVSVNTRGLCCPYCSDGIFYPSKFLCMFLSFLNIKFIREKTFDWTRIKNSKALRYDIFIPELNTIIEVHGIQHYVDTFSFNKMTLNKQKEKDEFKKELAIHNNITKYIVIDGRYSTLEYLKNSILNSELYELLDLKNKTIDWNEIHKKTITTSFMMTVINLYNQGYSQFEIHKKANISKGAITKYLKEGAKLKLCDYKVGFQSIPILKLDKDKNIVKYYKSLSQAENEEHSGMETLKKYCKNKTLDNNGFYWMYKEEYDDIFNR